MGARMRIPVLAYHNVDHAPVGALLRKLYVTPTQFERQMWTLRRCGFRALSMSQGLPHLADEQPSKCVILTFDDGYLDNLREAAPILKKYGFSATCYVVSGRIGEHNRWDCDELNVKKPLMNRQQLDEWLACGMEIGSHTVSHPRLDQIEPAAAEQEIAQSRIALSGLFGVEIAHFCYPYGRFNAENVKAVHRAGYRSAVATSRGFARPGDDMFQLPRVSIHGDNGYMKFLLKVLTCYEDQRHRRSAP